MKKIVAMLLALVMVLSMSTFAFAEEAEEKYIIYGTTTEITGDFTPSAWWGNGATDSMIRSLVHGYSTVTTDQGGDLVVDETVVKDLAITENEDGGKTFTITINEGLVYNNGEAITADDFIWYAAFTCSKAAKDLGTSFTNNVYIEGGKDFSEGTTDTITGIKKIDDYTFSVTYLKETAEEEPTTLFPYFYELSYASFQPLSMKYWLGENVTMTADENGTTFEGLTAENIQSQIDFARYNSDSTVVSCGAYQFVEYDASAKQATLVINPNYAGNFEGQKPSINKIVIVKAEDATWADAIKTGSFNFYDTITDGEQVNTAMDIMEDESVTSALGYSFDYVQFLRAGYGAVFFQCDFGPTQFPAVRKAIAMLLDRNEFANTFCQGWGGVVSVPASSALWQYQECEEYLDENLNTYPYDYEGAVALLVEDGWVYDAEGNDFVEGIRYKKVTEEEAGTYAGNVTLEDGTILMPLSIEWSSSEGNSVSELLEVMLAENPDVAAAGIKINQNIMTFTELLNYYYRDETQGEKYGVPTYCMFNLANNFSAPYSQAYEYTQDQALIDGGWNSDRIFDDELDDLSMDMVYGLSSDQVEEHLDYFQKLMVRWNELLPALPLYSNIYITMYPDWLENYSQDSFWNFEQAILYATIAE